MNNPPAFGIHDPHPRGNRLELFIGTFVGAITFSGSVIAFGKLAGLGKHFRLFSSAPVVFKGQHWVNLALALVMVGFGVAFFLADTGGQWLPFIVMTAIAFVLGVLIIIPIGGADMPVVISMLNSYSGWAAAGIGFSLNNTMLIIVGIAGGIVGRDPVLHHVQGDEPLVLQRDPGRLRRRRGCRCGGRRSRRRCARAARTTPPSCWATPSRVIIVPGYGLAVARAQHAVKEMAQKLTKRA